MSTKPRQSGFTLIELVVFVVIVSVGLAGVLSALNVTVLRSADPVVNKQMLSIAESLLEEVQAKDFDAMALGADNTCFTGARTQANRTQFKCVSDYNGFPSGTTGIYQNDGTAVPALSGYTANVAVTAGPAIGGVPAADVWQITVTVSRGADNMMLRGYRFNYGTP